MAEKVWGGGDAILHMASCKIMTEFIFLKNYFFKRQPTNRLGANEIHFWTNRRAQGSERWKAHYSHIICFNKSKISNKVPFIIILWHNNIRNWTYNLAKCNCKHCLVLKQQHNSKPIKAGLHERLTDISHHAKMKCINNA